MKLKSYLEGFLAHQKGERHWVMDVPGLNLYLSQLSVQAVLSGRSWEDHWPPPLRCCDVHEANIWANINPVSSSLHYDGNHNLLYVHSGSKDVLLVSPALTARLQPVGAHTSTPNHSNISRTQLLAQLQQLPHSDSLGSKSAYRVELGAGDCLFIPEGWWHQVTSQAGTFATSFWFRSPLYLLMGRSAAMAPYLLRSALHELLEQRLASWRLPSSSGAKLTGIPSFPDGVSPAFSWTDFSHEEGLFSLQEVGLWQPSSQQLHCLRDIARRFAAATWADMLAYWSTFAARVSKLSFPQPPAHITSPPHPRITCSVQAEHEDMAACAAAAEWGALLCRGAHLGACGGGRAAT